MLLFKEQLAGMTCQSPGCKHTDHDGGLFLQPRCHLGACNRLMRQQGVLYVCCATCMMPVAAFAITTTNEDQHILRPACHPNSPMEAYYSPEHGKLTINCAVCKEFVESTGIRSQEQAMESDFGSGESEQHGE